MTAHDNDLTLRTFDAAYAASEAEDDREHTAFDALWTFYNDAMAKPTTTITDLATKVMLFERFSIGCDITEGTFAYNLAAIFTDLKRLAEEGAA